MRRSDGTPSGDPIGVRTVADRPPASVSDTPVRIAHAPVSGARRGATLQDRFDPQTNSVNALRLGLAGLVLVSHTLTLHGGEDPLGRWTGGDVDIGTVGVDGFFALSGFLIARSYLGSPSTGRFLWRRCLRILPGFWVCLVVTAVVFLPVAQLMEFGTLRGFPLVGEESGSSYLVGNAALFIQQFEVRGLFAGEAVNGSLYTLFYEFLCYLGVAVLGMVGVLRCRRWVVLLICVAWWLLVVAEIVSDGATTGGLVILSIALRFGLMFLAGVVAHLWAHRVPTSRIGVAVAVSVLALALALAGLAAQEPRSTLVYLALAPPAVAYLVLLLGSNPRLARIGSRRDLSYGLYVYTWPVQVLLLLAGAATWPVLAYLLASLVLALCFAWASWTFVESPALAYKSWTPQPWKR